MYVYYVYILIVTCVKVTIDIAIYAMVHMVLILHQEGVYLALILIVYHALTMLQFVRIVQLVTVLQQSQMLFM